jgi:hypothetical protein
MRSCLSVVSLSLVLGAFACSVHSEPSSTGERSDSIATGAVASVDANATSTPSAGSNVPGPGAGASSEGAMHASGQVEGSNATGDAHEGDGEDGDHRGPSPHAGPGPGSDSACVESSFAPPSGCEANSHFDEASCRCVPTAPSCELFRACDPGTHVDAPTCACVPDDPVPPPPPPPQDPPGAACQTAADCTEPLPHICVLCVRGEIGGCAHYVCENGACGVRTCEPAPIPATP